MLNRIKTEYKTAIREFPANEAPTKIQLKAYSEHKKSMSFLMGLVFLISLAPFFGLTWYLLYGNVTTIFFEKMFIPLLYLDLILFSIGIWAPALAVYRFIR